MSIKATFPAGVTAMTVNGLHQWDYGRTLEIEAPDLPALVEIHFACAGMLEAVVRSCALIDGKVTAAIPDICLEQTSPVIAWVYEIGETNGRTTRTVTLPITQRAKPQGSVTIAPATADKYTEAVAAINAIMDGFENGGVVAGRAAEADHAAEAAYATEAGYATEAETAGGLNENTVLPVENGGTGCQSLTALADKLGIEFAGDEVDDNGRVYRVNATTTDTKKLAFTATCDRLQVQVGTLVIVTPDVDSGNASTVTFNLNGEGAIPVVRASYDVDTCYSDNLHGPFRAGHPVLLLRTVIKGVARWLCLLPWHAETATRAGTANNASNADAIGGYSFNQLFTSDLNNNPIAAAALALRAHDNNAMVNVTGDTVLALQATVADLNMRLISLEVLVKG